jgi:hypothetical protein
MEKESPMNPRNPASLLSLPAAFLLLSGILASNSQAQEWDEIVKPLSTCSEAAPPPGIPPEIELDAWIDTANPLLGFVPLPPGSVSAEKAAGEVCVSAENRWAPLPEEPYEKTDSAEPQRAPCAFPEYLSLQAGLRDDFVLPFDRANLTPAIQNAVGITDPTRWVGFDQSLPNLHFGHQFPPSFTAPLGYRTGLLTLHLRPLADIPDNDTISLWATGAPRGWSASLSTLGYNLVPGVESTLQLDLRTLPTGSSNLLSDVSQYGDLNVYIQDDTAVDDMRLDLDCRDSAVPVVIPPVGVLRGPAGCGNKPPYDVLLDNEDNRNANNRGGWIGGTLSTGNTVLRLCAVDGRLFEPAAAQGAGFAVVAFSDLCPAGFTRFDRFHDNEDTRPVSWDTAPSGSPTRTVMPQRNTNLAFCVAPGTNHLVPNSVFPTIGVSYGVFGGRTAKVAPWALERGFIYLDDEDRRNANAPATPPGSTELFLQAGPNTTYFFARVK